MPRSCRLPCMGKTQPTVDEVLRSARQMLEFARQGYKDFEDAGDRRLSGLYNSVTSGRSVTFVLQKLTGRAEGFPLWYAGVQATLKEDPVARWFVELRNRIEKEGTHGPSSTTSSIAHMNTGEMMRHAPENATAMFIGDKLGRSGWEVRLEDGSEAQIFFTLPASVGSSKTMIEDAPDGKSLDELLPLWLDHLDAIVTEAEKTFGGASR